MGLFRLLLLIAIVAAAFWLWRRIAAPTRRRDDTDTGPAPMVRCAHCGVHVPRTRALLQDDNWYCSQTHLEQGTKQQ
jgi:uncharacterized protein